MTHRAVQLFKSLSRRVSQALDWYSRRQERGIILLFHEVHDDDSDFNLEFRTGCTAFFFEAILALLRQDDWDIIPLDEAISRLQRNDAARRFAALTFDDGYRDTVTRALPILEQYAAPFTVYVPTGAITRELPSHWLGMRALFRQNDIVTISSMGKTFECRDIAAKNAAHAEVRRWLREDFRRFPVMAEIFREYDISLPALNDAYFVDEAGLKALAQHPLSTIGAHSESHPALRLLPLADARREMVDNRRYLEEVLDRPVRHFAYPYGVSASFGDREISLAAEVGFQTAVAAEGGCVKISNLKSPLDLPRTELAGTSGHLAYCFNLLRAARNAPVH